MKKLWKALIIVPFVCYTACVATIGDEGSSLESLGEVAFDLSGMAGLVLRESTTSDIQSNLQKLADDGTISQALTLSDPENASSNAVAVSYFAISPTDVHVMFNQAITVDSAVCRWVAVSLESNEVECVDPSLESFSTIARPAALRLRQPFRSSVNSSSSAPDQVLAQLEFDGEGNAVYLVENGGATENAIKKWDRESGVVSSLIDGAAIGFYTENFLLLADGSLVLSGELQGSEAPLYRYYPENDSLEVVAGIDFEADGMDYFEDGKLYLSESGDNQVFVGVFTDEGDLSFSTVDHCEGIEVIKTSEGILYSIAGDSEYIAQIGTSSCEEIEISNVAETSLLTVYGDYAYVTGTDSSDNYVFIRKALTGTGEEINLLGDQNLLVQHFDVADNGDVWFGALDLNGTTVYLYKYNNTSGGLEQLDSLPSDLIQIVLL